MNKNPSLHNLLNYCTKLVEEYLTLYLPGWGKFSFPEIGDAARKAFALSSEGEKEKAAGYLISLIENTLGRVFKNTYQGEWYPCPLIENRKKEILEYLP